MLFILFKIDLYLSLFLFLQEFTSSVTNILLPNLILSSVICKESSLDYYNHLAHIHSILTLIHLAYIACLLTEATEISLQHMAAARNTGSAESHATFNIIVQTEGNPKIFLFSEYSRFLGSQGRHDKRENNGVQVKVGVMEGDKSDFQLIRNKKYITVLKRNFNMWVISRFCPLMKNSTSLAYQKFFL